MHVFFEYGCCLVKDRLSFLSIINLEDRNNFRWLGKLNHFQKLCLILFRHIDHIFILAVSNGGISTFLQQTHHNLLVISTALGFPNFNSFMQRGVAVICNFLIRVSPEIEKSFHYFQPTLFNSCHKGYRCSIGCLFVNLECLK